MAEMPHLFYSPLDGILPHNAMGDVLLQNISALPTVAARSKHYGYSDLS